MNRRLTRRDFMKYGAAALGAVTLANSGLYFLLQQATRSARADEERFRTPIRFTPFTRALPIPPVKQPGASFTPRCAIPQVSGLSTPKFYTVQMKRATAEIIPGHPETVIWGYDGLYPGPTFRVNHNEPAIVRLVNSLSVNTIVHNHGGEKHSGLEGARHAVPSP